MSKLEVSMNWIEFATGLDWMPVAVYASLAMLGVGCLALRPAFRWPASERQRETPRRHSRPAEPPVLGARALSKSYRTPSGETVEVLQGVDLEIPAHGLTALIGPSGTGKSTLLNLFGGLDTPDRGQVLFRGEPLPVRECDALRCYRAQCVSFVFQELNLITHLTAEQNVALPLLRQGVPRRLALEQARDGLRALGMPARLARRRPAQLSGGERQRVAIARAMVGQADIVLADEPTGSLDPEHAEEVMKNLRRLVDERDVPVVMVTHNLDLAKRYADLILELGAGGSVRQKLGERS
jgi:ABC-type lipoprotein export system ATPase subunit